MTPFGIVFAIAAVIVSMMLNHGNVIALFRMSSIMLVVGGSFGATIAGCDRDQLRAIPRALRIVLKAPKGPSVKETVGSMLAIAKEVRLNPLILEQFETDDAFFKKGIQLITSTSDPERVSDLMNAEIIGLRMRHRTAIKFFADLGGFSPTFGILGTVIGLISVLGQLSSPGKLGPAIAEAFTATLWGVMLANAVWLPISNKLARLTDEEVNYREMVVEGLLTMQLNVSTTELKDRLDTFLPPSQRDFGATAHTVPGEATDAAA
ncbi:MAG: MotA/TolQ/ExbB proton channel family protein [Acidimicrobiales bacterium]